MIPFLITLLWFLLYAGLAYLVVWVILYFAEQLFGGPISPRVRQILYAIVGILLVIWLLTALSGNSSISPPWEWKNPQVR